MKSKKIGIVGCGRISERHISVIKENKNLELKLVCDIDLEKAKETAEKNNINYVKNITEIKDMDLIVICTPSGKHPHHVVTAAIQCNSPLILCEKPISLTVRETIEMFKAVKNNKKKLLAVFQNRYNPLIEYIRSLIINKKLGRVYLFSVNLFWNRNDDYYKIGWHGSLDLDGGILYTQASHYIDMLLFLFGKLKEAKGYGGNLRKLEVLDSISATLEFANGTVGGLNATISTYKRNYETELTIITENGTIRLAGQNLTKIIYWDVKNIKKPDILISAEDINSIGYKKLYNFISNNNFNNFPTDDEILSCISLMEKLSF